MSYEITEIQVALYLVGDSIDDAALNTLLQVEPVVSVKKGEQRIQKSTGQTFGCYSESTWGFSSAQAVVSNAIEDHTEWLWSKVSAVADRLRSNTTYKAWIEVTSTAQPNTQFVLPSRLSALAAELSATVGVVMCCDSNELCENNLILNAEVHGFPAVPSAQ